LYIWIDVLRDQSNSNKFWFYEIYENTAAVDFHKTQPHYQAWADFKESGGTLRSVSHKADAEFIGEK
jgi:quinol monooxygenase YgiN